MPTLILGFIGQAGSGKGTVADILREEYAADTFRFSQPLRDILTRLHLDHSRDHIIRLSETLRHTFGEDVLSHAIAADALASTSDLLVVEGIRRPEDLAAFKDIPYFHLIAIEADGRTRYDRVTKRGENAGEAQMSWEQFLEEDQRSTEITIHETMKLASHHIDNNGDRETLVKHIYDLIQRLRSSSDSEV